LHIYGGLKHLL